MLSAQGIRKIYKQGESQIEVLKGLNLLVKEGETVAIIGPSGGGKSTLLSILSGVDRPTEGSLNVDGKDTVKLSDREITEFRGKNYGIVFQQFHLIDHLTAIENVMLPLEILGASSAKEKALNLLKEVGLEHRVDHRPNQLSGGEAQRVAIARALVIEPKIILADEPSGNLDVKTGDQVMDLLFRLVSKHKSTMVLVTHNPDLAKKCGRTLRLELGVLKDASHAF